MANAFLTRIPPYKTPEIHFSVDGRDGAPRRFNPLGWRTPIKTDIEALVAITVSAICVGVLIVSAIIWIDVLFMVSP